MKERDEVKMTQLQPMTIAQTAEFTNLHDIQELISAFASNVKGVKALKLLHKSMLDGFKRYSQARNGDQFPGLAVVFHKTKDQLSGLTQQRCILRSPIKRTTLFGRFLNSLRIILRSFHASGALAVCGEETRCDGARFCSVAMPS